MRTFNPATEKRMRAPIEKINELVYTNRTMKKFLGVVSILLLLNGCSAIVAIPLPLRIASNIHMAVTVVNNMDDNPDNDGWIADNVREVLPQE